MQEHPYKEFENTPLWKLLKNGLTDLIDNQDIELQTPEEYVIGYLCKHIYSASNCAQDEDLLKELPRLIE